MPGGIHTGDAGSAMYAFFEVPDLEAAMAIARYSPHACSLRLFDRFYRAR